MYVIGLPAIALVSALLAAVWLAFAAVSLPVAVLAARIGRVG